MNTIPEYRPGRALLESVAAVALTLVLAMAVLALVAPRSVLAECGLSEIAGMSAATDDSLTAAIESAGLARSAEIRRDADGAVLLLVGLRSEGAVPEIEALLQALGFRAGLFEFRRDASGVDVVRDRPALVLGIQTTVTLLVGWLLALWQLGRLRETAAVPLPGAVWRGAIAGVIAFAVGMTIAMLLGLLGIEVEEQPWVRELLSDRGAILAMAPWIVIAAPLSEEVFFRGYLLRNVTRRTGIRTGIVVSSLVFSAVHLNPAGVPVYAAIGVVMALVYRRTRNLVAPIVAHAVHNALVLALWVAGSAAGI